jgi:hypothetical protein
MKMDKETLSKNGFWIGLGSFTLLWLIATLILWISAGGAVAQKQKAYDDSVKKIGGVNRPKNDTFLGPWNQYGDRFRKQKDDVWVRAWNLQGKMQTWPLHKDPRTQGRAAAEGYPPPFPNTTVPPTWRDDYINKLYVTQFEGLERRVFQFPDQSEPAVTFPTGLTGPQSGLIPQQVWKQRPSTEELWLAQEDFWVRREMLDIVKNVLDRVASFTELTEATVLKPSPTAITVEYLDRAKNKTVTRAIRLGEHLSLRDAKGRPIAATQVKEGDKVLLETRAGRDLGLQKDATLPPRKMPPGDAWRVFLRNDRAGWELDLIIVPQPGTRGYMISKDSTIKNIHPTRKTQPLAYPRTNKPLEFRLIQGRGYYTLRPEGEPLNYGESRNLRKKDYLVDSVVLTAPFEVKLVFDQDTSPIRQVTRLALAAHSHRTVNVKLKPDEDLTKLDAGAKKDEGATGGTSPATGSPMGGFPQDSSLGGGPPPIAGAGTGDAGGAAGYMAGQAQAANPTRVHKIDRNRYVQVTEQTKHLPVGMVLVVEQPYLQDALVEVANSPLRIQTTQVSARHLIGLAASGGSGVPTYPGTGAEGGADPGMEPDAGGAPPGMPPGPMPGIPPGGYPAGGFSPQPGFPAGGYPGGPKPPAPGSVRAEVNADLVELSIYGIAALYKKPMPKKPTATGAGTGNTGVAGGM